MGSYATVREGCGPLTSSSISQLTAPLIELNVVRVNGGRPLIEADPCGWDSRFTLNPTALFLKRSETNDRLIAGLLSEHSLNDPLLKDGVVAIFYRGVPIDNNDSCRFRSSVGCAVFTPDFRLLRRFARPVLSPSDDMDGYDFDGVEDQRITRIGDKFYLTYCGFVENSLRKVQICMAESDDLVNWNKLGPVEGDLNRYPNKNAALLGRQIDGRYFMFHRPSWGRQSDFGVSLAISDSPTGVWKDCGSMMCAVRHPRYAESWIGMGSAPIEIENGVFLANYHTGNFYRDGARDYFASFAILDFRDFDPRRPDLVVESRFDAVLFPETRHEVESPWPHSNHLNCIFPCGSYEYRDYIYVIYGGADAYVLAAKVSKQELIERSLEIRRSGLRHAWAIPL
jgi:predicted GH43/DUF377 family glycosyl hydrolase